MATKDVLAAGAVVFRPGKEVLLVHRPRYDDWSFPKGKLDPGEHVTTAGVREVWEETGLHVRLGVPLTSQRYQVAGRRMKTVSYWVGRAVSSDDVRHFRPNAEIDQVAWFDYDRALKQLTHAHDRKTLLEARALRRKTHALVVLRHADARSRKAWRRDDRLRPLLQAGRQQAQRLVPVLAAYDVTRIISSSSARCVETVDPFAGTSGWPLELTGALSEEETTADSVLHLADEMLETEVDEGGVVLCTHRPVLPSVFDALGIPDPKLEPGAMLVAHLRGGKVRATEVHTVR